MSVHRLSLPSNVVEETNPPIYFKVVNKLTGTGLTLDSLTLTLYDEATGTIINSRNKQDVLNANGVTVNLSGPDVGEVAWQPDSADMKIVTLNTRSPERHIALWEWTWTGGSRYGKREMLIPVEDLSKVP